MADRIVAIVPLLPVDPGAPFGETWRNARAAAMGMLAQIADPPLGPGLPKAATPAELKAAFDNVLIALRNAANAAGRDLEKARLGLADYGRHALYSWHSMMARDHAQIWERTSMPYEVRMLWGTIGVIGYRAGEALMKTNADDARMYFTGARAAFAVAAGVAGSWLKVTEIDPDTQPELCGDALAAMEYACAARIARLSAAERVVRDLAIAEITRKGAEHAQRAMYFGTPDTASDAISPKLVRMFLAAAVRKTVVALSIVAKGSTVGVAIALMRRAYDAARVLPADVPDRVQLIDGARAELARLEKLNASVFADAGDDLVPGALPLAQISELVKNSSGGL